MPRSGFAALIAAMQPQSRAQGPRRPPAAGRRIAVLALALALVLLPPPAEGGGDPAAEAYARAVRAFHAGRFEQARRAFARVVALTEARAGPDAPALVTDLNNLAEVERLLGREREAERHYLRALAILERTRPRDAEAAGTLLNNLALLYRAQGRLDDARALYLRALRLLEGGLGPRHPDVARVLSNLASLELARGMPEQALPLARRALEVASETLPEGHPTRRVLARNLERVQTALATARAAAPQPASGQPAAEGMHAPGDRPARFALHIASVRSEVAARRGVGVLRRQFPPLRDLEPQPPRPVDIPGKGRFWRILFGAFTEPGEAKRMCRRMEKAGAYCRVLRLDGEEGGPTRR